MNRVLLVCLFVACVFGTVACAPKCLEIKAAMTPEYLADDDVFVLNDLVEKRKALMEKGDTGEKRTSFETERLRFSVTAYELAIQVQLRIIKLRDSTDEEAKSLFESNTDLLMETRCLFDRIIEQDDLEISDGVGKSVQIKHADFQKRFKEYAKVASRDLKAFYKNGIPTDKKRKSKEELIADTKGKEFVAEEGEEKSESKDEAQDKVADDMMGEGDPVESDSMGGGDDADNDDSGNLDDIF